LGNYVATITGTSNQVLVAGSGVNNAAITLSTPQDIATTSNVRFNSLGIGMAASATAGRIDASGDIVAYSTSDINFKENIVPIVGALSMVKKIEGVGFNWKDNGNKSYGHIAQRLEEILPELVDTNSEGVKSVNYNGIIAFLVEAVKEMDKRIIELESK
jgi:hypothetical protein